MSTGTYDSVSAIVAYEQGDLGDDETVELFQHLVDTGSAWRLGDEFATMANFLIEEGDVVPRAKHVEAIQAYISMH